MNTDFLKEFLNNKKPNNPKLDYLLANLKKEDLIEKIDLKSYPQLASIPQFRQYEGSTILHIALNKGQFGLAQKILEKATNLEKTTKAKTLSILVNMPDPEGRTPLSLAYEKNTALPNENKQDNFASSVIAQASAVIAQLVALGANDLTTEFMVAFQSNNLKQARILMQRTWTNEELQKTIFNIVAFESNNLVDVKILGEYIELLAKKENGLLNTFDENGETPLMHAIWKRNHELIRVLIRLGADPNQRGDRTWKDWTPLKFALIIKNADPMLCRVLLENKADPNLRGSNETVPLEDCLAYFEKHPKQSLDSFKILLNFDANPFIPISRGLRYIPLKSFATEKRAFEFLDFLEQWINDPKRKFTKEQRVQQEHYRKYLEDTVLIKKYSQSLGLSQKIELTPPEAWMNREIDTEGIISFEAIQELCQELQDYCTHLLRIKPNESKTNETWNKILNAFKAEEQYLLGHANAEDMIHRMFDKKELTTLCLTSLDHEITIAIYDGQLIVSNKGYGKEGTGLSIYQLKPEDIEFLKDKKENFIESLYPRTFCSADEALLKLKRLVGDKKPWAELPVKSQPHGTCAYTNAQAIVAAVHFIDNFNQLKRENKIDPKLPFEEVPQNIKDKWLKLKDQATTFAVNEKKKFTHFRRQSKINAIAKGNRLQPPDNEIFKKLTMAFLSQHYLSPDMSPAKAKKRFYELEYACTLLQSLDLKTRKEMLRKLEEKGIHLQKLSVEVGKIIKGVQDKDLLGKVLQDKELPGKVLQGKELQGKVSTNKDPESKVSKDKDSKDKDSEHTKLIEEFEQFLIKFNHVLAAESVEMKSEKPIDTKILKTIETKTVKPTTTKTVTLAETKIVHPTETKIVQPTPKTAPKTNTPPVCVGDTKEKSRVKALAKQFEQLVNQNSVSKPNKSGIPKKSKR